MRGSGEIFGTRQSGIPEFQVADIVEDYNILRKKAWQIAKNRVLTASFSLVSSSVKLILVSQMSF